MQNKRKTTAAIVLGVVSLGALFFPGYFALILAAFAPGAAWMPLIPAALLSLIGLVCGIRSKSKLGIVINSITLFIIFAFVALVFYRI